MLSTGVTQLALREKGHPDNNDQPGKWSRFGKVFSKQTPADALLDNMHSTAAKVRALSLSFAVNCIPPSRAISPWNVKWMSWQ